MECAVCGDYLSVFTVRSVSEPKEFEGKQLCSQCYPHMLNLGERNLSRDDVIYLSSRAQGEASSVISRLVNPVSGPSSTVFAESDTVLTGSHSVFTESEVEVRQENKELKPTNRAEIDLIQQSIQITSGFNFEGYRITAYLSFVSAETATGMGLFKTFTSSFTDIFSTESQMLRDKLASGKEVVLAALKTDTHQLGGNAIIGLELTYTMLGDSLVAVIMSGTAVRIEPIPAEPEPVVDAWQPRNEPKGPVHEPRVAGHLLAASRSRGTLASLGD